MRRMLVAYDGTESSGRALGVAIDLAKALDAAITLIGVIPTREGWPSTDPCDDEVTHALELCEAREIVRRSGLEPALLERAGDPAETIERIAGEGDFDMVVVGSSGPWDQAARYVGGSVSEHVAAHARVTVVVAR
jgi:nucleotide-binding universal stress UspA family protein